MNNFTSAAFTVSEALQYARLTFKQHGLQDYDCEFFKRNSRRMGWADPWNKKIAISQEALRSFPLFRHILLHEVAHLIQYKRQGNTFIASSGRRAHHNKVFNQVCKELGIPKGRFVPSHLLP